MSEATLPAEDGHSIRLSPVNEQLYARCCVQCGSLLVGTPNARDFHCVQCGHRFDPVILRNQIQPLVAHNHINRVKQADHSRSHGDLWSFVIAGVDTMQIMEFFRRWLDYLGPKQRRAVLQHISDRATRDASGAPAQSAHTTNMPDKIGEQVACTTEQFPFLYQG